MKPHFPGAYAARLSDLRPFQGLGSEAGVKPSFPGAYAARLSDLRPFQGLGSEGGVKPSFPGAYAARLSDLRPFGVEEARLSPPGFGRPGSVSGVTSLAPCTRAIVIQAPFDFAQGRLFGLMKIFCLNPRGHGPPYDKSFFRLYGSLFRRLFVISIDFSCPYVI